MKFQNIKTLLNSNDRDSITKALVILSKNPCLEFEEPLRKLQDIKGNPSISALAAKALNQTLILKGKFSEVEQIEAFRNDFASQPEETRMRILKALLINKIHITIPLETVYEAYLSEKNDKVVYLFAEVFAQKFPSKIMILVESGLLNCTEEQRWKNHVILVFLKSAKHLDGIIEEYRHTTYAPLLIAGSRMLWKVSPILVHSRLKELVDSKKTPLRITASIICKLLNYVELKGIIEYLMTDRNDVVRTNAEFAYRTMKFSYVSSFKGVVPCSVEVLENLRRILEDPGKVYEKLTVIKILESMGNHDLLGTMIENLRKEKNSFLISAYVKFIGRHSGNNCIDLIASYLKHPDQRVVANCIEGFSNCTLPDIMDLLLPFIDSVNHRIASCAAVILWKFGITKSVLEYFDRDSASPDLWARKSVVHALDAIHTTDLTIYLDRFDEDPSPEIRERVMKVRENLNILTTSSDLMEFIVETGKIPEDMIDRKVKDVLNGSFDTYRRVRACRLLSYMVSGEHFKTISGLFENFELPHTVRIELLKILCMIGENRTEILVNAAHDCNSAVRCLALESLKKDDCTPWIDDLMPLLFDEDTDVVTSASTLLNVHAPESVVSVVQEMVLSMDEGVRMSGLNIIELVGSSALNHFASFLVRDPNTEISLRATSLVRKLKHQTEVISDQPAEVIEYTEESPRIMTPLEVLSSLSEVTEPSVIEERFAMMEPHIGEEHLVTILSVAETTTNVVLLSKISILLGKFSSNPDVRELIARLIEYPNERVSANTIESLIHSKDPVLYDILVQLIPTSEPRVRYALIKLIFGNPIYGDLLLQTLHHQETGKILLESVPEGLLENYLTAPQSRPEVIEAIRNFMKPVESLPAEQDEMPEESEPSMPAEDLEKPVTDHPAEAAESSRSGGFQGDSVEGGTDEPSREKSEEKCPPASLQEEKQENLKKKAVKPAKKKKKKKKAEVRETRPEPLKLPEVPKWLRNALAISGTVLLVFLILYFGIKPGGGGADMDIVEDLGPGANPVDQGKIQDNTGPKVIPKQDQPLKDAVQNHRKSAAEYLKEHSIELKDTYDEISAAEEVWKKMSSIETETEIKCNMLVLLVRKLENSYFRGEFNSVKKFLAQKDPKKAANEFFTATRHIRNDEVLWDAGQGIWMKREEVELKILEQVQTQK